MSVTKGSIITQADIAAIITIINNECTRRITGTTVTTPTQGSIMVASLPNSMVTNLKNINAIHTYSPGVQIHNGGVPKVLAAQNFNFIAGTTIVYASTPPDMNDIQSDIAALAGQTQCTNTQSTCGCNGQCANGCSCNYNSYCSQCCNYNSGCNNCACNTVCGCEYV